MHTRSVLAIAALAVSVGAAASPLHAHEAKSESLLSVHTSHGTPDAAAGQSMSGDHSAPAFVSFSEWSGRVQGLLDQNISYPQRAGPVTTPGTGVVRIKFNCSESGKPDKVSLMKSSGDWALDKAAIRAMSRVATLHPLPTGFNHGQRFEALVVFADNERDARLASIAAEQKRHNAWYHDPVKQAAGRGGSNKTVIALAPAN
jgi:protein TonB